jgi:hypothetical protein
MKTVCNTYLFKIDIIYYVYNLLTALSALHRNHLLKCIDTIGETNK